MNAVHPRARGEHWYKRVLPRAAFVYPQIGWLWRTAEQLHLRGEIKSPERLRDLVEAALPSDDLGLPSGISAAADDALADAMMARSLAAGKLLTPISRIHARRGAVAR